MNDSDFMEVRDKDEEVAQFLNKKRMDDLYFMKVRNKKDKQLGQFLIRKIWMTQTLWRKETMLRNSSSERKNAVKENW